MALTATEEALLRDLLAKQAELIALANNETTITAKLGSTKATIDDLTAATTVADADLMIVRQGGVDKKLPVSVVKSDLVDLSSYAPLASPALTGTPTAPTATAGTKTKQIATTEFIATAITNAATPVASETVAGKIEIATSAEAIAGTDTARAITPAGLRSGLNASGSAPVYACRAWVNFNGTGTVAIRASGNVSSITDNGTGDYTVNFTTEMPDANYAVTGFARKSATDDANPLILSANHTYIYSTSAVQIKTVVGYWTFTDGLTVCVAIFR